MMRRELVLRTSLFSALSILILVVAPRLVHPLERGSNDQKLIVGNGMVSLNLKNAPIRRVLEGIERQAKIHFSLDENAANEQITASFLEIPLEHALKRILRSLNYSLIYNKNNELNKVIILGKKGTSDLRMRGRPLAHQRFIAPLRPAREERLPGGFEVLENTNPPGEPIGAGEDADLKVIKNAPPPGGSTETTEEEQEQSKAIAEKSSPETTKSQVQEKE